MISYKAAEELINKETAKLILRTEEVGLTESSGRIIAEDVFADVDSPPFDNSAMDGFAIKFSSKRSRKITGELSAGNYKNYIIKNDEAVGITTGGKLPEGADTVIPIEDVSVRNDILLFNDGVKLHKGLNVRPKGSDLLKDNITVSEYKKINPAIIATLAGCGKEKIKVYRKLKAGILTTGDELIPISEKPTGDKIRVSNNYALRAAFLSINQTPVSYGFMKDDKNAISEKVTNVLSSDIDIFLTTGGVSAGKYDFIKEVFEEAGVTKIFWKVNIKPGMPFYFGVYKSKTKSILVFGLPGNPVSALVNFYIFIEPAIRKLFRQKKKDLYEAVLQNDMKKNDMKMHFSRGNLYKGNEGWEVTSHISQSSGNYIELGNANCLIITDEDKRNPMKGETVKCIPI